MKRLCLVAACGLGLLSGLGVPSWPGAAAQPAPAKPAPVNLHARTTGELAALCGADAGTPGADVKISFCHGFAQGALDDRMKLSTDKKPVCIPPAAPNRAATMKEFVGWVRATPANIELPVLDGLFKFLGERFPCKS